MINTKANGQKRDYAKLRYCINIIIISPHKITSEYCGTGCQTGFGTCNPSGPVSTDSACSANSDHLVRLTLDLASATIAQSMDFGFY